jgi:uncharacterized protein (TIGR02271 family)
MTKTVVALYDSAADAETVVRELSAAGLTDTEVVDNSAIGADRPAWRETDVTDSSLAAGAPGVIGTPLSDVSESGIAASSGTASEGIMGRLRRAGVPEDDSHIYAEGVRRGGSLVIARLSDDDVDRGLEIMSNYRPVDIDERGSTWRQEGWSRYDESAGPYTGTGLTDAATSLRDANVTTGTGEETVIPIVEEQLSVGKREVDRGKVRVRSYVVETPVEETVRLRDESVHVERRKVDRPADVTADDFRERSIDVTESAEEAVVSKTARVTEEVVVSKDVTERTERVADTVRRTEVDVDNAAGANRRTEVDVEKTAGTDRLKDRPVDRDRDI